MFSLLFAGLVISSIPAGNPDHTLRYEGVEYDVYILEKAKRYRVKICGRYHLTGTRFERNTCRHPSSQEPVTIEAIGIEDLLEISPQLLYRRRVAAAEKVANELVNKTVSVETFWSRVAQAIVQRD